MNFIAHRGDQYKKKEENTLKSFQSAIENPIFAGFECDVRTSKDGVFVIHHDIFIDGHLVNSLTYKELKELYHITSLEEVLNLNTDKIIMIEIKEPYLDIDSFLSLINQYPHQKLYIDSFDNEVIQQLAAQDNHAKYGVLNYLLNSEQDYSEYEFIGLLSPIVTDELIEYFENQKMEVFLYGIRNIEHVKDYDHVYYIVDSKTIKKEYQN